MVKDCASPTVASLRVKPLYEGAVSKKREFHSLTAVRDALMPKLLLG